MPAISDVTKRLQASRRLFADCSYGVHRLCAGRIYKGSRPPTACACPCHGPSDDARPARYGPYDSDVFDSLRDGSPVRVAGGDAVEQAFAAMRRRAREQADPEPAPTDPTSLQMNAVEQNWGTPEAEARRQNRERIQNAVERIADAASDPYATLRALLG